jgi:hypothetical protein
MAFGRNAEALASPDRGGFYRFPYPPITRSRAITRSPDLIFVSVSSV